MFVSTHPGPSLRPRGIPESFPEIKNALRADAHRAIMGIVRPGRKSKAATFVTLRPD
jgi:hypothetical protein